jgi:hypothetical protein
MRIRLSKLRQIIKEVAEDPQAIYDENQRLRKAYQSEWELLGLLRGNDGLSEADYEELIDLRDHYANMDDPGPETDEEGDPGNWQSPYDQFFHAVSPQFDRRSGRHVRTNKFNIPHANVVRSLFDGYIGKPLEEVMHAWETYSSTKDDFQASDATSQTDLRYGRRTSNVVHVPTGQTVSSSRNREGSLGS